MAKTEITNMVMVQDKSTGKVLVQERVKNWCGIAFPGGHIEPDESIYDSAVREIKEETGLDIKDLKPCGFMHWYNNKTEDRYFTYFYKTHKYSGELLESTCEGRVFWADIADLPNMPLASNFIVYLEMFLNDKYSEAYCSWNEDMEIDESSDNPWGIVCK